MTKTEAQKILGLSNNYTEAELKRAYATLAAQFHPERYPEEFEKIINAYSFLKNYNASTSIENPFHLEGQKTTSQEADSTFVADKWDDVFQDMDTVVEQKEQKEEAQKQAQKDEELQKELRERQADLQVTAKLMQDFYWDPEKATNRTDGSLIQKVKVAMVMSRVLIVLGLALIATVAIVALLDKTEAGAGFLYGVMALLFIVTIIGVAIFDHFYKGLPRSMARLKKLGDMAQLDWISLHCPKISSAPKHVFHVSKTGFCARGINDYWMILPWNDLHAIRVDTVLDHDFWHMHITNGEGRTTQLSMVRKQDVEHFLSVCRVMSACQITYLIKQQLEKGKIWKIKDQY